MQTARDHIRRNRLVDELRILQDEAHTQPYSIVLRLQLAKAYKSLGYPDLAVGDAYKALLLVDEVLQEGEYHDEALEAAQADITANQLANLTIENSGPTHGDCLCHSESKEVQSIEDDEAASWAQTCWSRDAYEILVGGLIDCGCLRSAFDYNSRALKTFPQVAVFEQFLNRLTEKLRSHFEAEGEKIEDVDIDDYPDKGFVRREQYPWNNFEPDRFSEESLHFLNEEMEKVAPRLEVKVADLPLLTSTKPTTKAEVQYVKQLGVFAKENIPPGEQILQEKSLLTAISRLHESYCDACSAPLPEFGNAGLKDSLETTAIACDDCDEVFFCSSECYDLAREKYHPSLCGVSVEQKKVPAKEVADSLYSLLLVRTLALAESQELHPLELKEVRYIWGDYHGLSLDDTWRCDSQGQLADAFGAVPQTLPFSFQSNVLTPFHILEKMDVNLFEQSHRYDIWVFNTLYAKFRGTASAQQGLDGRPEIGAVHPLWCLANHSCDPNVAWEWQGSIKFWTREKLVEWKGRQPGIEPGIAKGQEVFSHYCDIRLPVKERREWAVGALGGDCLCPRCIWEAEEQYQDAA